MHFDCVLPAFFPWETVCVYIYTYIYVYTYVYVYMCKKKKKTKKENRPTDPIFQFWACKGNITIFFWPYNL